jgi:xanthine/CO dehydrogenase XdhC/CoxF family maturation factor
MNEQSEIICAFESLRGEGKPAALVTVVAVAGSAYRRPGAKMLVAEDGRTWGGISGGCLERDVARRSRGVLASGRPLVCRYETTDDQDLLAAVATGCRGTVDLFIEPLSRQAPGPVPWLIQATRQRRVVTLATIVRSSAAGDISAVGTRLSLEKTDIAGARLDDASLRDACLNALSDPMARLPKLVRVSVDGMTTDVFVERLSPPQQLVVFGAGPDVVPVVSMAALLGWHVTVVGVRPATGLARRFAQADELLITPPDDPLAGVELTPRSAVVLMTHNYPRDIDILSRLPVAPCYLGILGPRIRTEQLFAEVGGGNPAWQAAHAPVGLDLGAETPAEIALSIVAEIQAVLRSTAAGFLRDRQGPIHRPPEGESAPVPRIELQRVWREVACPM